MKRFKSVIASVACCSLSTFAVGNVCELTASLPVEDLNGQKIYLVDFDTDQPLDSTTVSGKTFSFKTAVGNRAIPAALSVAGKKAVIFILEPGKLHINEMGITTGSTLNDRNSRTNTQLDSLYSDYRKQLQVLSASGKPMEEIMAEAEKRQEVLATTATKLLKDQFDTNKDNALGYLSLIQLANEMSMTELNAILTGVPEWIANSNAVRKILQQAENLEKTAPGKMFTDFSVKTSNGKTVKLSDYVGKGEYVLVDFFASWCGPCMREMPNLKQIHNKYNGKGLKIVGLAVWNEPADTKQCVENQNLPWTIIDNAQTIPTDIYGVTGIPHIIMFAPDGKIAFRGLTGEQLVEAVDKIMAK